MGTFITTIVSVVLAIAISGAIFFGANWLIDQSQRRWAVATAGVGGVVGLLVGAIVQHNGWIKLGGDIGGPLQNGWLSIVLGGMVGAAAGYGLGAARTPDMTTRIRSEQRWRPVVFVGPAVFFVFVGLIFPSLKTLVISFREGQRGDGAFSLANYDAIFNDDAFFNVTNFDRIFTSRLFIVGLAGVVFAIVAAYASTQDLLGTKRSQQTRSVMRAIGAILGLVSALVVIGFVESLFRTPNQSWVFDTILTPLVSSQVTLWLFVAGFFALCAFLLSEARGSGSTSASEPGAMLAGQAGRSMVGPSIAVAVAVLAVVLGIGGAISGAESTSLALFALGVGALLMLLSANQRSQQLDLGAPSSSSFLVLASILLLLALFSSLESVLWNNLWWVATVTGLSTVFGLLLAILADRAKGETYARTMIFMPMAISMVGAAVIWDFMYELTATGNQTGLINAILQGLGFEPRGFFINSSMIPWNNFWIMLIMVWIQTGFAMVILSAAIKGVPDELLEAARVDGATEVQVFWRVIIPQIRTTIVVVVTTLIIIVMKVFDLVKATTGGANRTNVLANEMFNELRDRNFASSSAFATVIFLLVLPVMIFNVRRNLKEMAG